MDIVNLIESNPITKMTGDYQSKIIERVQNNFTNYEQQMFLASFYCYLNNDYNNDFIIIKVIYGKIQAKKKHGNAKNAKDINRFEKY